MKKILTLVLLFVYSVLFSSDVLKYKINSEPLYLNDSIIKYEILYLNIKNDVKYEFKHNDIEKTKIKIDTLKPNIHFIPCINDTIEIKR